MLSGHPSVTGLMPTIGRIAAAAAGLFAGLAIAQAADQPATVRLWNWSIHDKKYQQSMYKLFNQRYPDIKIEYSSISNTVYDQTLEAAFIANDPPDLFIPSGKLSFNFLREKQWIKPLSDVATSEAELKDWMARYPSSLRTFVEGVSVFDGKPYIVGILGDPGYTGAFPLYYNKILFAQAGIAKPPATYGEFRQAAARITQTGQGKFFGISHGLRYGGVWHQDLAGSLAHSAGAGGVGGPLWEPDLKDGTFHTGDPAFVNALQVWMGMRKDGSVFPGETTMDDEAAKMAFATNKAAMFFGGDWVIGNVMAYNPDADFDLVLAPTPDDGIRRGYSWSSTRGGAFGYTVSSSIKKPKAVWEVIKFITSLEYQEGWVRGGYGISFMQEANKPGNFRVPQMYRFIEWGYTWKRIKPSLSESAIKAYYDLKPGIYPDWNDVVANVYLGSSGIEALKDLDKRLDDALEAGIKKAQETGLKVARKDFAFPDWDPTKDYEPAVRR